MTKIFKIILFFIFFTIDLLSQQAPSNAILRNFHPYPTPRTNGRPGEVYRVNENGVKYIVQDISGISEKISEEGDLVGRMYFTSKELLSFLNLEFDRVNIIPAEVKILKAKREYTEQTQVDKTLYDNELIKSIVVDPNSEYFLIREAILTKDVTFRFAPEIVKKIKRGSNILTKVEGKEEVDFPFEVRKKFKKEKRIFYLEQKIKLSPYD
ncbi:MAG: hypothetical protein CR986_10395 [Ignavibacteriae bacterium]|nr:MAG: hypothetical protein CR986_10395 [Ignavibacteriota bacterium]